MKNAKKKTIIDIKQYIVTKNAAKASKWAETNRQKAKSCWQEIIRLQKHNRLLKIRIDTSNTIENIYAVILGTAGGLLGVLTAVVQLMEKHGPALTTAEALGAALIYIGSAAIGAIFFALMGILQAEAMLQTTYRKYHTNLVLITVLRNQIRMYSERKEEWSEEYNRRLKGKSEHSNKAQETHQHHHAACQKRA